MGARFYGDARGFLTVGEAEKLTFAARGQIGSVLGASVTQAPADYLFYSGGGGTVRGQPYQSLGLDTVQGMDTVTTGGTSFAGAQLEARYLIREKISLVGFYDFGHVGGTATPGEGGDWHAGAGIGIRYDTGIGPIRLDLGTQASGDNAGSGLQVYIGIGQAF
jgi:translocation and assembly module TamA